MGGGVKPRSIIVKGGYYERHNSKYTWIVEVKLENGKLLERLLWVSDNLRDYDYGRWKKLKPGTEPRGKKIDLDKKPGYVRKEITALLLGI